MLFCHIAQNIIKIIALMGLVFLLMNINWKNKNGYIKPGTLLLSSLLVGYVLNDWDDANQLIFRVHQAGNDGLTYISYGRNMLQHLLQGDIGGFLRGSKDIFYFMPGLRYFRALEMIIFGSTNFGYILLLLLLVLFVWKLLFILLHKKIALLLLAIFVLTPWLEVFGFALGFYESIMLAGFSGSAAFVFLIMGLYLIFSYFDDKEKFIYYSFWTGLSLALAVFIRPNLALMVAIFLLGIFSLLIYKKRFKEVLFLGTGFSFILLVPLHNIYFGNKFVPLTSAAFIKVNFITSPAIYWQALQDFFNGYTNQYTNHVLFRWNWWLEGKYDFLPFKEMFSEKIKSVLHGISIIAIIVGVLYRKLKLSPQLKFLIAGILIQHISMFMWRPSYRYSAIVWLLTFIISVLVVQQSLFNLRNKNTKLSTRKFMR